jgi:antitoxin component of MazEF toxin-antitoxin module
MKIYTTTVVEEGEDLVFNVPDQILENLQLDVGDTVEYVVHDDYIVMKKVATNLQADANLIDSLDSAEFELHAKNSYSE